MNTASQDLRRHLDILQQKLAHPTNYEAALAYFLEEFAGDVGFHIQGEQQSAPHLKALFGAIVPQMLGKSVSIANFKAIYLSGHGFFHGQAVVERCPLIFLYFERTNVGLTTLVKLGAAQLVARFHLPEPTARNPSHN